MTTKRKLSPEECARLKACALMNDAEQHWIKIRKLYGPDYELHDYVRPVVYDERHPWRYWTEMSKRRRRDLYGLE